ncbi:MAG: cytochrome c maturation protein CcmE [Chitinophagales bacterium]
MNKLHIVLLLAVALGVGVIIAQSGDYTTYANFGQAKEKAGKAVNVVGYLVKDKEMTYDPKVNPDYFAFYMTDKEGVQTQVIYKGSKPQDFERSEQLVVKGKMDGEIFKASEISMKCPSKYVNDKIIIKESDYTVKSQL